jgi:hypothetical protein
LELVQKLGQVSGIHFASANVVSIREMFRSYMSAQFLVNIERRTDRVTIHPEEATAGVRRLR